MRNRWSILAVLFLARTAMGFQFQSIGALSPLIIENFGISLADIGLLIGLYMAPGVIVAIPGGAIAGRFGDKRIVGLSMILMFIGCAIIAWAPSWNFMIAGRVIAGVGGVALNVVMTKMVVDWFVGREISTAMAIFINSWPIGIALALLTLPAIAAVGGLSLAWITVLATIAITLAVFLVVYITPDTATVPVTDVKVTKFPAYPLFLAGSIWALYNTALAMVFSFGPALLTERGLPLTSASSSTSLFMALLAIGVPLGGILADRSGRRDTVILVSLLSYLLLMPLVLFAPVAAVPAILLLVGFLFGLGAGPIVGMPATILPQSSRAFAMGVYYSLYYLWMMIAPLLAGALADYFGQVGVTFVFGVGLVIAGIVALGLFRPASARLSEPF
jgi:MFS family permease